MEFSADAILALLPHRFPMLLIDRVTDCQPGVSATAVKCVSQGEPWAAGHFPGRAVMPGVLILEALAQTGAAALMADSGGAGKIVLFAGVRRARFRAQVEPGDVLTLSCAITRRRGSIGVGTGVATVNGKPVCTAEVTFALTDGPQP
jgi:3-hydroxyacyl-[acyl-carrier-protein] dehydratase